MYVPRIRMSEVQKSIDIYSKCQYRFQYLKKTLIYQYDFNEGKCQSTHVISNKSINYYQK